MFKNRIQFAQKSIPVIIFMLGSFLSFGQNPSDGCAGVPALPINGSCVNQAYTLPGNYSNGGLVNGSCMFGGNYEDGWYSVTATTTGNMNISLEGDEDHTLSVWDACGGGTELACDIQSAGSTSSVSFAATIAATYYVQVHRNSGNNGTTMYGNICAFETPAMSCASQFVEGTQAATYTASMVRGYHFTAPVDFTICQLYIPNDMNTQQQHVEVVRFTAGAPPAYAGLTNSFVSLFNQTNWVPDTPIPCSISIMAGDIIGIYGARGNTSTMYNSYGAANYLTDVAGSPITIYRSGMQFTLNASTMHDIWSEVAFPISRIDFWYDPVVILPVELTLFEGHNEGATNLLEWITESEMNNDYFSVERSDNGTDFEEIAVVNGVGTSLQETNYDARDSEPLNGPNYYRLKQVDFNGNFNYSDIIVIDNASRGNVSVYPNPAVETLTISLVNPPVSIGIVIVRNAIGKKVLSTGITTKSELLNVENLPKGLYIVKVTVDGESSIHKFIKN